MTSIDGKAGTCRSNGKKMDRGEIQENTLSPTQWKKMWKNRKDPFPKEWTNPAAFVRGFVLPGAPRLLLNVQRIFQSLLVFIEFFIFRFGHVLSRTWMCELSSSNPGFQGHIFEKNNSPNFQGVAVSKFQRRLPISEAPSWFVDEWQRDPPSTRAPEGNEDPFSTVLSVIQCLWCHFMLNLSFQMTFSFPVLKKRRQLSVFLRPPGSAQPPVDNKGHDRLRLFVGGIFEKSVLKNHVHLRFWVDLGVMF